MNPYIALFLIVLSILGLAFAFIGIKMFLKKDGKFEKHCASIEFENGEKVGCVCNSDRHEDCPHYEEHHGVNATRYRIYKPGENQ